MLIFPCAKRPVNPPVTANPSSRKVIKENGD